MVREHRLLTVKEGVNRIQFSWANTLIDPTSIEFRILDKQDKVDLVDTTFPAGRNDALQWNIKSQIAGIVAAGRKGRIDQIDLVLLVEDAGSLIEVGSMSVLAQENWMRLTPCLTVSRRCSPGMVMSSEL